MTNAELVIVYLLYVSFFSLDGKNATYSLVGIRAQERGIIVITAIRYHVDSNLEVGHGSGY